MPTLVLVALQKALNWVRKHPVECLVIVVVLLIGWGRYEHNARVLAEANSKRLVGNIEALQDTTKFLHGQNERMALTIETTNELLAEYQVRFDSMAKAAGNGPPVVGVVVTRPGDSATVTRPVAARADTASIDTLGVHAAVEMTDSNTTWRIRRDPSTISVLFTQQDGKSYVVAQSDDGARLEVESPFIRTTQAEPSKGLRVPLWVVPVVAAVGFGVGAVAASK